MLLYYIRHGDPTYDPDALTPLGRRQAEAVGKRLSVLGVDRIFASTSNRAIETAQPTAEMLKKEITQLDFCHENYAWDQLSVLDEQGRRTWAFCHPPTKRLFASEAVRALGEKWYTHPELTAYPFEAGIERIRTHADAWLASLGYVHEHDTHLYLAERPSDERVALFAHEGFGLAFLSCVLDIPYPLFCLHFGIGHSGMTVIHFEDACEGYAIPKALMVASDGHLYGEGLHTNYQNRIRI